MAGDEAGWVQWSHNRGLQSASQTFRNRDLPRIFTWSGPWGKGSGCSMAGRREWGGTVCSNMVFLGSITQTSKQAFNGGLNETWTYFCWRLKSSQWSLCLRRLPEDGGMGTLGEKTPDAVITQQRGEESVSTLCDQGK